MVRARETSGGRAWVAWKTRDPLHLKNPARQWPHMTDAARAREGPLAFAANLNDGFNREGNLLAPAAAAGQMVPGNVVGQDGEENEEDGEEDEEDGEAVEDEDAAENDEMQRDDEMQSDDEMQPDDGDQSVEDADLPLDEPTAPARRLKIIVKGREAIGKKPKEKIPKNQLYMLEELVQRDSEFGESRRKYVHARKVEWPGGELGPRNEWVAVPEPLGSGSDGVAVIYQRQIRGAVVDRVVAKDCFLDHSLWTRWEKWDGDPRDPKERTPMEIKIMQNIKNRVGSNKVLFERAHQTNDDALWYRIYMDFCPHGDLWSLIGEPWCHGVFVIPEAALWSFFNDLVEAFLLLEYGGVTREIKEWGWKSIVHRDIKLDNVFLDVAGTGPFPAYPKCRVGDFGHAIMTDESDPNNPLAYTTVHGTETWQACEQLRYIHRKKGKPLNTRMVLGMKTNVWGIGAVIIRLMNQDNEPKGPKFIYARDLDSKEHSQANARARKVYSSSLIGLAEECMEHDPNARPTLVGLKESIQSWTTPGDGDKARGMRTIAARNAHRGDLLRYPKDMYKTLVAQ